MDGREAGLKESATVRCGMPCGMRLGRRQPRRGRKAVGSPLRLGALGLLALLLMGKTGVGALVGGLVGVELTKAAIGLRRSTGDLFVLPLLAGIAIGRIGCFLTGLDDHTHGLPTTLPWGVDFGDGIPRHPTQLYEIGFLLLLALALRFGSRRTWPEGRRFQLFLGAYLAFRLGVDALKPMQPLAAGLGAIQWAALLGLIWCLVAALADSRRRS